MQAESTPAMVSEEGQGQSRPATPRLEAATPTQPPPGLVPPAASTAMSAPQPAEAMHLHPSIIAMKWGHTVAGSEQLETPDTQKPQARHSAIS